MPQKLDQVVFKGLESEDPNILRASCFLAGRFKVAQAERALLKALQHQSWQVQAEAARALGSLASAGALAHLRRILKASDADLRQKILAAAAGGGQEEKPGEPHPELKKQTAVAINRINPKITQDALLAALTSGQSNLVSAALAGLANLEAGAGHEQIVSLLDSPEAGIRGQAAACAGRLRLKESVPKLMELLKDADAGVRKEAVIALNHIKDKKSVGPLSALLADRDPEVRGITAIALGNTHLREPELIAALSRGLSDNGAKVRLACLQALANLKAETALEEASALLGDTDPQVARQAAVTVTLLGQARERPDFYE